MTTKSPPWFRFYSEVLSDRKIQRICRVTNQPKALVVGVWATILAMASDAPDRGKLLISDGIAITIDDISIETGLGLEQCEALVSAFIGANMVHQSDGVFIVTQWDSRQYKSDTSNDRVSKYRDKKRDEEGKPPKRPYNKKCNVTVTPPESDTESDTDTEYSSPNGEAEKPPKPQKPGKRPDVIQAVQVFVEVTKKYCLNKTQMGVLKEVVGDSPIALEKWRGVVTAWNLRGYKTTDVDGMLQWFKDGIPERNGGKVNGNPSEPTTSTISPERAAKLARLSR